MLRLALVTGSVVILFTDPEICILDLVTIVTTLLNILFQSANVGIVTGDSIFEIITSTGLTNIDITFYAAQEVLNFLVIAITLIATVHFILLGSFCL